MRADIITLCLALTDPLTPQRDYDLALHWWDVEVFWWREARGLITDDERMLMAMIEPIVEKNGCGQVCATFGGPAAQFDLTSALRPLRNPGRKEVA